MPDLVQIKSKIADMAKLVLSMWQTTFDAFMEHDRALITEVLEKEKTLNLLEKELNRELVDLGRNLPQQDKEKIAIYINIVGDLELMGDYYKDILERVEIKITEKLLFSDAAVEEYTNLYHRTETAMKEVVRALEEDDPSLVKEVVKKDEDIDDMVDGYRNRHNQRMLDGLCSPIACNMYLNMLDFTAAVYYHSKKIARNLLKIK
ncbi:MAG: PhoU domain-containing protein [Candidatus Omnitrophota bacterium]